MVYFCEVYFCLINKQVFNLGIGPYDCFDLLWSVCNGYNFFVNLEVLINLMILQGRCFTSCTLSMLRYFFHNQLHVSSILLRFSRLPGSHLCFLSFSGLYDFKQIIEILYMAKPNQFFHVLGNAKIFYADKKSSIFVSSVRGCVSLLSFFFNFFFFCYFASIFYLFI